MEIKKKFIEWAEREIELKEKSIPKEEINNAYKNAFQAYCNTIEIFQKDPNYFYLSIGILQELLFGECLTPIEDNDEDWIIVGGIDHDGLNLMEYQSTRRPSLKKYVDVNPFVNKTLYIDDKRAICFDVNTEASYTGGIGFEVLNEMLPITMPYEPYTNKIIIYTEDFKYYNDSNGDVDTFGVLYFKLPNGELKKVYRFFKNDPKTNNIIEIDKSEYFARKEKVHK